MNNGKIKSSIVIIIFLLILLTMNITNVINITENAKFNIALSDIFVFFIVIIAFYPGLLRKYSIIGLPFWISLLSWIVLVGFINLFTPDINSSGILGIVEELIKTGICIIYFILGYNYLNVIKFSDFKKTFSIATIIFVFGGIIIYLLASKGIFFWSNDTKYNQMFMGTDTDPNHAATFLTISFFAFGFFLLSESNLVKKVNYIFVMAISIFGIILTGSRGGLTGFIVGLIFLFIYYIRKNRRFAVSLVIMFSLIILLFFQTDLSFNEGEFTNRILYKIANYDKGLDIRGSLSTSAFMMGNDHPLFGVGRGNFKLNSAPYFDEIDMTFIDDIPHNTFLGLYSEVGIIGLFLFMMPVWFTIVAIKKRYERNIQKFFAEFEVMIWIFAGTLSVGVQALVLNIENRRFIWFISGMLLYYFKGNIILPLKHKIDSDDKMKILAKAMIVFTLFAYVFISYDAYVPYRTESMKGDLIDTFSYEIPTNAVDLDSTNQLGINLQFDGNDAFTDRLQIEIVELDTNNNEKKLYSKSFKAINGQIFMNFKPSIETHSVKLKMKRLDPSLTSVNYRIMSVISNDNVYDCTKWYFLSPNLLRTN